MMRLIVVLAVVCVSVVGAVADPFSFEDVTIEYWAGAGQGAANEALLVLDFENEAGSFAFGYGWSGTSGVLGIDLIKGVQSGGDFSFTSNPDETFVLTMSYGDETAGAGGYPGDYLMSFVSYDGAIWDHNVNGVANDVITSGMYYGWSTQNTDPWPAPPDNQPTVPVPEPGTISLFGLGAALVAWRKHRNRA
jgi:hypothetical protein